jgi:lipopolysaccharide/colanic/teichoic acid biosynthesis glycosyltransferase
LGSVALILLSPVMLAAAILVRLSSEGPIIFRQERIGQFEHPFTMLKFRTMRGGPSDIEADKQAFLQELKPGAAPSPVCGLFKNYNDGRLTPIGRVLRRYSIDELPQLFNVLRGEMSLVGPRPALEWEVSLLTPWQRARHLEKPGMTGLWQVSGRNLLTAAEMFSLDVKYVETCSLRMDLWILLRTPVIVLFHRYTR